MKSVDQMSDAELDALLSKSQEPSKTKSVDDMSDQELDALLSQSTAKKPEDDGYGPVATFAGNALDTLTLDHGPNLISAAKNLSFSSPAYIKDRDSHREQLEKGKENNPISRYAGATAGAVVPLAATFVAPEATVPAYAGEALDAAQVAKSAIPSIAKAAAKNFGIGEAMTALQNPGDVKGQASGLQLQERFDNATDPGNVIVNAMTAGASGAIENKLAKMGANKDKLAYQALQPSSTNIKNAFDFGAEEITPDRAAQIGQFIKNSGVLNGNPDIIEIARRTSQRKENIGTKIGNIFADNSSKIKYDSSLGPLKEFTPSDLVSALNKKYEGEGDLANSVAEKVSQIISDRMKNKNAPLDLSDLQNIRQNLQGRVNYNLLFNSDVERTRNEMFNDAANFFNRMIEKEIDKNKSVLGENISKELKIYNKQYNLLSDAEKIATKAAANAEKKNSPQNLLESIIPTLGVGAGVGAYSHSPLYGGLAAGATMAAKAAVPRANSIAANIAASPTSQAIGQNLGMGANILSHNIMGQNLPPMTPFQIDQKIKDDQSLTPSQKLQLRNENRQKAKGL